MYNLLKCKNKGVCACLNLLPEFIRFLLVHVLWKIVSNHSELIFSRLFIFYEALTTLQSWRVSACLTFLQTETTWHFCMLFSNCHFFVLTLGLIAVYDGLSRTAHSMWNFYKPWIRTPKRCYFILSPLSLSWGFHSSVQNLTDFFKELSIGLFRLHSQAGIAHLDLDIVSKQCAFFNLPSLCIYEHWILSVVLLSSHTVQFGVTTVWLYRE